MSHSRTSILSAVYILLFRRDEVLLLRRFNTGWEDGMYSLPSGHLDGGEPVCEAALREAKEEIGVDIDAGELEVLHTMHRLSGKREYIDFFVKARKWKGRVHNMEPDKCDDLLWISINKLPKNVTRHVRHALDMIGRKVTFSEFDWDVKNKR